MVKKVKYNSLHEASRFEGRFDICSIFLSLLPHDIESKSEIFTGCRGHPPLSVHKIS